MRQTGLHRAATNCCCRATPPASNQRCLCPPCAPSAHGGLAVVETPTEFSKGGRWAAKRCETSLASVQPRNSCPFIAKEVFKTNLCNAERSMRPAIRAALVARGHLAAQGEACL